VLPGKVGLPRAASLGPSASTQTELTRRLIISFRACGDVPLRSCHRRARRFRDVDKDNATIMEPAIAVDTTETRPVERAQDGQSRTIFCLTGNLPLYMSLTRGPRFWLSARDCLPLEANVAVADDDVIPVSEFVNRHATFTINLVADFEAVEAIAVCCSGRTTVLNRRRSYAIPIF
jgi:hypothetical protein